MKFNREVPLFGKEHCKLQASVIAVRSNQDVVMIQTKDGVKEGYGFMSVNSSDFECWKKDDSKGVEKMWNVIDTVTPEDAKTFLQDLGLSLREVLNAENILI